MITEIKSIELEGHASYRSKTFVGPFSPGLNVIAGEGSSGKTSILTAMQWAISGFHPPNYHESPAGKADKVSVKINLCTEYFEIPGVPGDQPKALEMCISRDGGKKYLLGSSELSSHEVDVLSTMIVRPDPRILFLPQGTIASLLENHDSDLWGIFTEYVMGSNEVSKTLVSRQKAQGRYDRHKKVVDWLEHVLKVVGKYKEREMAIIETILVQANDRVNKLNTIINKVIEGQVAAVCTMEKNLTDVELEKSYCDKYLQCLSLDYSNACKQLLRIEAKQAVLSKKNAGETKESLERKLVKVDSGISNEINRIAMRSDLINDKVERLPKEVMRFIARLRGLSLPLANQVGEHERVNTLLSNLSSTVEDDIASIKSKIRDLPSQVIEAPEFKSMEQLDPTNPDFWPDIFIEAELYASECKKYCGNHAKLKEYEANLCSKEAEKQKTLDRVEQQRRHHAAAEECDKIQAAILSPSVSLTPSDIPPFYRTWNALSKDKSTKVLMEANLVLLKAAKWKLEQQIWSFSDAVETSRQALEAAERKVLDCYECIQVPRCTLKLQSARMTWVQWEVDSLKNMMLDCELEATSAMHGHKSVFTDPGETEKQLKETRSEMLRFMEARDDFNSYICELENFEVLEELPEKFSEVFSSLVKSCGKLILHKDKEGKCFDLSVQVNFGGKFKAMGECDHIEKTVVILCMILALHLRKSHIFMLDGIDANIDGPYKKALWQWIYQQSVHSETQFIVTLNGSPKEISVDIDKLFTVTSQCGESTVKNPTLVLT